MNQLKVLCRGWYTETDNHPDSKAHAQLIVHHLCTVAKRAPPIKHSEHHNQAHDSGKKKGKKGQGKPKQHEEKHKQAAAPFLLHIQTLPVWNEFVVPVAAEVEEQQSLVAAEKPLIHKNENSAVNFLQSE